MSYMRCINNKPYLRFQGESANGDIPDLTIGAVYKALPTSQHERDAGLIRIIDNSGEDYLYPASYFQPIDLGTLLDRRERNLESLTIHVDPLTKAILHAEALAARKSVGALLRQWIEEWLDLVVSRDCDHQAADLVPKDGA